jgi:hypothetical protein
MTKIKITQKQYDIIILNEQKRMLTESNDKPDYKNDNNVILAFYKLMGMSLSGMNEIDAEKALKQETTLSNIHGIVSNKEKLSTMIDDLIKEYGNDKAKDDVLSKKHTIIKNFRETVKDLGLEIKLTPDALKSFNDLK